MKLELELELCCPQMFAREDEKRGSQRRVCQEKIVQHWDLSWRCLSLSSFESKTGAKSPLNLTNLAQTKIYEPIVEQTV